MKDGRSGMGGLQGIGELLGRMLQIPHCYGYGLQAHAYRIMVAREREERMCVIQRVSEKYKDDLAWLTREIDFVARQYARERPVREDEAWFYVVHEVTEQLMKGVSPYLAMDIARKCLGF